MTCGSKCTIGFVRPALVSDEVAFLYNLDSDNNDDMLSQINHLCFESTRKVLMGFPFNIAIDSNNNSSEAFLLQLVLLSPQKIYNLLVY